MSADIETREASPFGLAPGTITFKETAHGIRADEVILAPVEDTMSCRGAHYMARRGDSHSGKGRIVCYDAASVVLVRA